MKRLIVVIAALAAVILLQLTIIDGLPLPGGGAPDLVLLCVVAIGLVGGQEPGLIAGFCAGLAIDLAPPATELIGQYALVFCLVGYISGRLAFTLRRSAVLALAAAAGAVVLGEVLVGGLVVVLDTPEVTLAAVAALLPSSVLYDVVFSPVVLFLAVRIAVAIGVSFNPLDDSPALETGGSARPMGLARLARLRQARHPVVGSGVGAGGSWLTGDSAAGVPAVGAVGWLSGPATTRKARREQARLSAALTGAEPRKGAVWVGSRPAGLRPTTGARAAAAPSGLDKLKPDSGVAGSATREALVGPGPVGRGRHPADGAGLPKIAFGSSGGAGQATARTGGDSGVPKIAFGSDSAAPKISFGTGGLPGTGRAGGRGVPRIRFGDGGLPGAGRARPRRTPRIAFGSGLPRAPRLSPGRPALPRFSGSGRSAAGSWLATSRLRSAQFDGGGPGKPSRGGGGPSYGGKRSRRPKAARLGKRRRHLRWLPLRRRAGGRSSVWRISRQIGGEQ